MAYDILISKLTSKQKHELIKELIQKLDQKDECIKNLVQKIEQKEQDLKKADCQSTPDKTDREVSDSFDCLAVTQVQVFPFRDSPSLGHVKALASVVLNDQLHIRGLRVMDGANGLFVGFPLDPFYKGEDFRTVVFPITRQLREHIENCVLEKYQHEVDA